MTISDLYVMHKIAEEMSEYWSDMMRETFCDEDQRAKMGADYDKAYKLAAALDKKLREMYEEMVKEALK